MKKLTLVLLGFIILFGNISAQIAEKITEEEKNLISSSPRGLQIYSSSSRLIVFTDESTRISQNIDYKFMYKQNGKLIVERVRVINDTKEEGEYEFMKLLFNTVNGFKNKREVMDEFVEKKIHGVKILKIRFIQCKAYYMDNKFIIFHENDEAKIERDIKIIQMEKEIKALKKMCR